MVIESNSKESDVLYLCIGCGFTSLCCRAGGHVQHHAGHLSEELLREHQGGHPAAAVPEQGQYSGNIADFLQILTFLT